jgi:ABC-type transport system substrate-binding protein
VIQIPVSRLEPPAIVGRTTDDATSAKARPGLDVGAAGGRVAGPDGGCDRRAAQGEPRAGGTLEIAFVPSVTDIDVNARNVGSLNEQAQYIYETLFDRDGTGQVVPLLAREFTVSEDGLVHTWALQPDVTFHDGTPFDAEAVKWNLERKIELQQPLWDLIPFAGIEVVDPLTVRVTLTRPSPGLYGVLAAKTFSMYSPSFAQEVGDEGLKSQASGTGPFTIESFVPNESLTLAKNPTYWQEGLPYLDGVVFRAVPDINARAIQLEAGDVDMAMDLSIQDIERLRANSELEIQEGIGSRQYYITLNNRKAPLDDVRVRQALNYAVDKEGIIRRSSSASTRGWRRRSTSTRPSRGSSTAGSYAYDPDQARALLEEAGWVDADGDGVREKDGQPLALTLHTRRGGAAGDIEIAELVQGMLQEVGVGLEIILLDSAAFIAEVTKPAEEATYDLVSLTVGTFTGDAEYIMETFYACDSAAPRYYNRAYFCDPEVDRLIEEAAAIPTLAERNAIYSDVVKRVYDQAPILMLFDAVETVAMRSEVEGVYFEPAGVNWPAKYAWLNEEG